MIEPTDEMVRAYIAGQDAGDGSIEDGLSAVLAIVERDRLSGAAAVRRAIEEAVDAALLLAGGPLVPPLKLLRRTLDEFPAKATS